MTMIEKIRAEIENLTCDCINGMVNQYAVLQIINKYADQEPCDDVVSRQAVLDGIEELKQSPWATDKRGNGFEYLITEALDMVAFLCVKQEPSVRPQEQTGHWKRISMDRYTTHAQYWYECDKCGEHNLGNANFCPNCGAKMGEPQESEG